MKRREVITLIGGAAAMPVLGPLTARAQPSAMPVIGWLSATSTMAATRAVAAFRSGLSQTGFVEGQNVTIDYRWAEGDFGRLPALANDLVSRRVAVIAASPLRAALVVKTATATIPIVFAVGADPVKLGLVASFNRPGGNITGVSFLLNELVPKRLELLRALVGNTSLIACLFNPTNTNAESDSRAVQGAADALGQRLIILKAGAESEFDAVFATIVRERAGALFVGPDALFSDRAPRLIALAARHSIPATYGQREAAEAGGLMSYATSDAEVYREVGSYVGRILNGEHPADLPVVQPTKLELVINLKTAKALGLAVPAALLALADEVIE